MAGVCKRTGVLSVQQVSVQAGAGAVIVQDFAQCGPAGQLGSGDAPVLDLERVAGHLERAVIDVRGQRVTAPRAAVRPAQAVAGDQHALSGQRVVGGQHQVLRVHRRSNLPRAVHRVVHTVFDIAVAEELYLRLYRLPRRLVGQAKANMRGCKIHVDRRGPVLAVGREVEVVIPAAAAYAQVVISAGLE